MDLPAKKVAVSGGSTVYHRIVITDLMSSILKDLFAHKNKPKRLIVLAMLFTEKAIKTIFVMTNYILKI